MKFPNYFPKNFPPSDVHYEDIFLYRLCSANLCEDDFQSYYQMGKGNNKLEYYGLSMLSTLPAAKAYIKLPTLTNKKISGGNTLNDGVWKHTPSKMSSDHCTWWLNEEAQPWKRFKIIKEDL